MKKVLASLAATLFCGFTFAARANVLWSPPIRITKGGTYTGNWRSTTAYVPAVNIETSEPVTLKDCRISSVYEGIRSMNYKGGGKYLPVDRGANLSVYNCLLTGENPNVVGRPVGNSFDVARFHSLKVNNVTILNMQGMRILNYDTDAADFQDQFVRINNLSILDVNGRGSDGTDGYSTQVATNAIGFNTVLRANVEVSKVAVINSPFKSSVEDVISSYNSGGTATNPMNIHDNYIQGGYAINPAANMNYTGVMINIGDAPSQYTGFVNVYNNQLVSFENAGIGVYGGHDNFVYKNRILSAQKTGDGTILGGNYRSGLNLWDYYNSRAKGWQYSNSVYDNAINVVDKNGTLLKSGYIIKNSADSVLGTTNPWGHAATHQDEIAEYRLWLAKLGKSRVGCWVDSKCSQ
jgi:hypothetical protein